MSDEEKKETYLFYSDLNNKNEIHFELDACLKGDPLGLY
jgi:hypothetical protein